MRTYQLHNKFLHLLLDNCSITQLKHLPDAQQNFDENERKKEATATFAEYIFNQTWIIFFRSKKQYRTKKNILKATGRTDRITNGTKAPFYAE